MAKVTIQYWAAAKEAAGLAAESVEARTLGEALEVILARRTNQASPDQGGTDQASTDQAGLERLRSVLAASSFLIDGVPAGRRGPADLILPEAARIEVLPPFAGG